MEPQHPPSHKTAGAAPKGSQSGPTPTEPETILVVEDNDDLRDVTQMQLQRLGYAVFAASDAAHGLDQLRRHPEIGLLLSDIVLAGGTGGPEMALQALEIVPGLAVLFITGYSDASASEKVARFGPDCLLYKPVHQEDLAKLVRDALDHRRARGLRSPPPP